MKSKLQRAPLLCWDIYATYFFKQANRFNRQMDIDVLNVYKEEFGWLINIEHLITNHTHEALVLTDVTRRIQWVNKGFIKMTGYSFAYAKGKKPNFLQGKDTSQVALNSIRENLKKGIQFKETLVNYRKDGIPYKCVIEIFPIKDINNSITHLLALEHKLLF